MAANSEGESKYEYEYESDLIRKWLPAAICDSRAREREFECVLIDDDDACLPYICWYYFNTPTLSHSRPLTGQIINFIGFKEAL